MDKIFKLSIDARKNVFTTAYNIQDKVLLNKYKKDKK